MPDGISIDTSALRTLATDLGKIPGKAEPGLEVVMKRAAQNIKTDMQAEFRKSTHFRGVAGHVSYDRTGFLGSVGYEIGPEVGGAGSLAGIAVNGGANGGGGTVDIDHVLEREAPNIEREVGKILDRLL
ncbi:hypothetical protein GCM10025864_39560 [Luteimicrobium album]|uniref:HK97 gp10 family phage protein n=2 Tax=Luteimicrobium album TaxID=1054550 RepID=A0ABQ6I6Y0_9MICO|nr:hypothetical protein GCM10025864_39560 [Luteimicrobium album]